MLLDPATYTKARLAVMDAGVVVDGHFVLADGAHATRKVEMDHLWEHPAGLNLILDLLAGADGLPPCDVILGVPSGGQGLAQAVGKQTGLPIALLERVPGGTKQDFRFQTAADIELATRAQSIRIYEDVVTTLSSVAGVVKLLDPSRQTINSLAIWRRGEVKERYRRGLTDHYLIEEAIPSFPLKQCPVCTSA